ncbi:MAG: hypothetical protein QXK37_01895 [Candidatus Woesearchaeota archaeon]
MDLNNKIRELEEEIKRLKEKEKKLEHDIDIFNQVFHHIKKQFEDMQKEILKKK